MFLYFRLDKKKVREGPHHLATTTLTIFAAYITVYICDLPTG